MITENDDLPDRILNALENRSPLLPERALRDFVCRHLSRGRKFLADGSLTDSPAYLFEPRVLAGNATAFKQAFASVLPKTACFFAMKSNNCPQVLSTLTGIGFGLDVSSGVELNAALAAGADAILFSGPGKTIPELELALINADRVTVLMDSFGELHRLGALARESGRTLCAGVRLTTGSQGLWRKFGIPLADLETFFKQSEAYPEIHLQGLQFHCSWNMSPHRQVQFIEELASTLRNLPEQIVQSLTFLDLGGGYWPEMGEWLCAAGTPEGRVRAALGDTLESPLVHYRFKADSITAFAEAIGNAVKGNVLPLADLTLYFEPGRWIVNDAMHLLMTVVDVKPPDIAITDAGTNAIGWERFETDYFPVINLTRPKVVEKPAMVLGSLCTPHDVWGYSYWGEDLCPGDLLLIPAQGAYTYSLRQQFIKPIPVVTVL